jgi:hypothetical protein
MPLESTTTSMPLSNIPGAAGTGNWDRTPRPAAVMQSTPGCVAASLGTGLRRGREKAGGGGYCIFVHSPPPTASSMRCRTVVLRGCSTSERFGDQVEMCFFREFYLYAIKKVASDLCAIES